MLISKQNFLKLKSEFRLERVYNVIVAVMIGSIFVIAYRALHYPIHDKQYHDVVMFSHQASNPKTQEMARQLLRKTEIDVGDYLKLMQAYQFESAKAKHYPAMSIDDQSSRY